MRQFLNLTDSKSFDDRNVKQDINKESSNNSLHRLTTEKFRSSMNLFAKLLETDHNLPKIQKFLLP